MTVLVLVGMVFIITTVFIQTSRTAMSGLKAAALGKTKLERRLMWMYVKRIGFVCLVLFVGFMIAVYELFPNK